MRCHQSIIWVFLIILLSISASPADAGIIYVKSSAIGANNGTSWADAYTELQSALAEAVAGDEVWVAAGTYKPDYDIAAAAHTGDSSMSFPLSNGVSVWGGFPINGNPQFADRNPSIHATILSGDLAGNDGVDPALNEENSYHVVTFADTIISATLNGCTITAGHAFGMNATEEVGGGIYISGGHLEFRECVFKGNRAKISGGAAYVDTGSQPIFRRCSFEKNESERGGAIAGKSSAPKLNDCRFIQNDVVLQGGAVYIESGAPSFTSCTFDQNTGRWGGGIYARSCQWSVANCTFNANSGSDQGGGIYDESGEVEVINSEFTSNRGGGMLNTKNTSYVSGCLFSRNFSGAGGGILNFIGAAIMADCIFLDNSAEVGGGVYSTSGFSYLRRCIFDSNTAESGGGLAVGLSDIRVSNSLFINNVASNGGGVSILGGSNPGFANCTLSGNHASRGSGIMIWNSPCIMTNCIVWDNQLTVDSTGDAFVDHSCIEGGYSGAGNIDVDPRFGNSQNGNFHLAAQSPCIDAGRNFSFPTELPFDLDGNPRFLDDPDTVDSGSGQPPVVDMGAYEFLPARMTGAVSRKLHAGVGDFDIDLLSSAQAGVECRAGGPTLVIITFSQAIDATGTAVLSIGSGNVQIDGKQMIINDITGVPDRSCLKITLVDVRDLAGNPLIGDTDLHIRILEGDTTETGSVSGADVAQTRSRADQRVDATNFRSDIDLDGDVDAADLNLVRNRSGHAISCR